MKPKILVLAPERTAWTIEENGLFEELERRFDLSEQQLRDLDQVDQVGKILRNPRSRPDAVLITRRTWTIWYLLQFLQIYVEQDAGLVILSAFRGPPDHHIWKALCGSIPSYVLLESSTAESMPVNSDMRLISFSLASICWTKPCNAFQLLDASFESVFDGQTSSQGSQTCGSATPAALKRVERGMIGYIGFTRQCADQTPSPAALDLTVKLVAALLEINSHAKAAHTDAPPTHGDEHQNASTNHSRAGSTRLATKTSKHPRGTLNEVLQCCPPQGCELIQLQNGHGQPKHSLDAPRRTLKTRSPFWPQNALHPQPLIKAKSTPSKRSPPVQNNDSVRNDEAGAPRPARKKAKLCHDAPIVETGASSEQKKAEDLERRSQELDKRDEELKQRATALDSREDELHQQKVGFQLEKSAWQDGELARAQLLASLSQREEAIRAHEANIQAATADVDLSGDVGAAGIKVLWDIGRLQGFYDGQWLYKPKEG